LNTAPRVVLEAPPGAGKTTRVPLALLDAPWCTGQKMLMLEPRRIAARAGGHLHGAQLGEAVGGRQSATASASNRARHAAASRC
jgi:ATP-dependent helicase HrpB